MIGMRRYFAVLCLFMSLAAFAGDDILTLTDEKKLKGTVVEETQAAVLFELSPGNRYKVPREKIKSLLLGSSKRAPTSPTEAPAPEETKTAKATPASAAPEKKSEGLRLELSSALAMVEGSQGGTFLAGASVPLNGDKTLRIALHSGLFYLASPWLPVWLSVLAYPTESLFAPLRPYFGVSVGPVVRLSTNGATSPVLNSAEDHSVLIAVLLRPGLLYSLCDTVDAAFEIPVGGLSGIFYIAPTLALTLRL